MASRSKKSSSLAGVPPKQAGMATDTPARTPTADELRWRAEDALSTITRAEQHKRDPQLMRHVKRIAKEKMSTLSAIARTAEK